MQAARKAAKEASTIHPSLLPPSDADAAAEEAGATTKKKKRSSRFDVSLDVSGRAGGDGDYEMSNGDGDDGDGQGGDKPTRLLDSCEYSPTHATK